MNDRTESFFKWMWLEFRLYSANEIVLHLPSHTLRLWFYRCVMKFRIGKGSSVFMSCRFDTPGQLSIGANSTINRGCRLDSRGSLTIGDNVSMSTDVIVLTASHDIQASDFAGFNSPVTIGDYVFIGTRAMILPGVTLGKGCVIAAGAVVSRDVSPYTIVGGVPARPIGTRTNDLNYEVNYRRLFQ